MNNTFLKTTVKAAFGVAMIAAVVALTGCQTGYNENNIKFTSVDDPDMAGASGSADEAMRFAKDDLVIVIFSGLEGVNLQPHEERIKEDGTVTLPLVNSIKAEGKTTGELQREIHNAYVPSYYKRLTVTVKTDRLLYYVQGYVRQSGRQEYLGPTTVLKAIASAGDFNDFANRREVIVTRKDGTIHKVNCEKAAKNPALDIPVFPGDKIEVKQRGAFTPW